MAKNYDLVIAVFSFFFNFSLKKFLSNVDSKYMNSLIKIESDQSHRWQLANQRYFEITSDNNFANKGLKEKKWVLSLGLVASSKFCSTCTPRILPNDLSFRSILYLYDLSIQPCSNIFWKYSDL